MNLSAGLSSQKPGVYWILKQSNLVHFSSKPTEPAGYWEGSSDMPIYEQGRKIGFSAQELAEIIFRSPRDIFRCRKQPLRVRSRKAFLIDLRFLTIEDLNADENGTYKHQATRSRTCYVTLDDEEKQLENFQIVDSKKVDLNENTYHLIQRHRVCQSCSDLKTIVSYFEGRCSNGHIYIKSRLTVICSASMYNARFSSTGTGRSEIHIKVGRGYRGL